MSPFRSCPEEVSDVDLQHWHRACGRGPRDLSELASRVPGLPAFSSRVCCGSKKRGVTGCEGTLPIPPSEKQQSTGSSEGIGSIILT